MLPYGLAGLVETQTKFSAVMSK